jgi:protease PrsW
VNLAIVVGLSFAPALFWLWFFARRDKHPEPLALLIRTFAWGAAMVIPAAILEVLFQSIGTSLGGAAVGVGVLLATVGPIEEVLKFAAARNIAKHREFDEPIDGLIYATAASLGFATLENIFYLLQGGAALILVRGPISTLAHILFALPWGYALSLRRFKNARGVQRRGVLIGAALHSLFDVLLAGGGVKGFEWLLIPFLPLMLLMWWLAGRYYALAAQDGRLPEVAAQSLEAQGFRVPGLIGPGWRFSAFTGGSSLGAAGADGSGSGSGDVGSNASTLETIRLEADLPEPNRAEFDLIESDRTKPD